MLLLYVILRCLQRQSPEASLGLFDYRGFSVLLAMYATSPSM
jgi:hypothetical protein